MHFDRSSTDGERCYGARPLKPWLFPRTVSGAQFFSTVAMPRVAYTGFTRDVPCSWSSRDGLTWETMKSWTGVTDFFFLFVLLYHAHMFLLYAHIHRFTSQTTPIR